MSVSDREADQIRLKKYYEPRRKRAILIFFLGLALLIVGAVLYFWIGEFAYFFLVPGFVCASFGAYTRRVVDLDIEKVGTRLNEKRNIEDEKREKAKTKKIGKYTV
jgi:hypothetical protein